jgi:hypothetical protein
MGVNEKRVAPPAAYASPVSVERVGHQVDEDQAFELLRDHSQRSGRKLIDVAEAVVGSHTLLAPGSAVAPPEPGSARPTGSPITNASGGRPRAAMAGIRSTAPMLWGGSEGGTRVQLIFS